MTMREILFRGKRKGNGEWVEGSYLHLNTGKDYICDGTFWINKEVLNKYKVDPETVGQYTGLTDKNGKKIFEGDIVEYNDGYYYFKGIVKYELGAFGIACKYTIPLEFSQCDNFISFWDMIWNSEDTTAQNVEVEVIGNVYDDL
jgi:uncharacterized phage protein (TIGR01671 family)